MTKPFLGCAYYPEDWGEDQIPSDGTGPRGASVIGLSIPQNHRREQMNTQIIEQIIANEHRCSCLSGSVIRINDHLIRYSDDLLRDMYDRNFFEAERDVSEEDYERMLACKAERGDRHLKVMLTSRSDFLIGKGLEEGVLLTMAKADTAYPDRCGEALTFRCLKKEDIREDLTGLEMKHYAEVYGADFTKRKCERLYGLAADRGNGLHFFAAYLGDVIAASCSAFYSDGVVGLDDLITDRDYRHRGIATALMKYVHCHFDCPLYLHADNDDTPKEMYRKLGFSTVKSDFEYLKCDSTDE